MSSKVRRQGSAASSMGYWRNRTSGSKEMTVSWSDSVRAWRDEWSRAHVLWSVPRDIRAAQRRLELAERNIGRSTAQQRVGDYDAALIFAEQALINVADAMLARDGFRVSSHVARLKYPLLPGVYFTERALVDQIRGARNAAQYDADGRVAPSLSAEAIRLATRAVADVRRMVESS